jgi:guanylate kinase
MTKGPLIVISGPSGVGKDTIVQTLLADRSLPLWRSVSATTRPPRAGEVHGRDYFFWSADQFEKANNEGKFLEFAEVHGKYSYGTPAEEVERQRRKGIGVILVIDVRGFEQVKRKCPDALSIFVSAPSEDDYRNRLEARGSEDANEINRRIERGRLELAQAVAYNYRLINANLEQTVKELRELIVREFQRRKDGGSECSMN